MFLDEFDPEKRVWIDIESISWDDARGGLLPYHGDRVAGVAICDETERAVYIPLRHRTQQDACVPFDEAIAELRAFAAKCTNIQNIKLKFDLHS